MTTENLPNLGDVLREERTESVLEKTPNTQNDRLKLYSQYSNAIAQFVQYLMDKNRSKEEIKEYINEKLLAFYKNGNVRHSYFQISAVIQSKKSKEATDGSVLMYNLDVLMKEVATDSEFNDIGDKLYKFYDHCQLELSRLNYFESIFWRSDQARNNYESLLESSYKAKTEISALNKQIANVKTENITILGIFAAIVIGGIGSFTGLGNVFTVLGNISMYKFLATVSFVGLIIFNVSFMLVYMIAKITGRNIYTVCIDFRKKSDEDCLNATCKICTSSLGRIKNRLPYVYWFNLIGICIIIFSLSIEYIVMKYAFADWACILVGFGIMELAIYYGIKNSKI